MVNAGFNVQDMINEFAKLGLHAKLKEGGN
jgi:hypothetical protein